MGTALEKIQKKMLKKSEQYSQEENISSQFITTRGGILKYGEEELPGNEMLVVVVDAIHENTYYPDKFDPDVMLPPKCFAFGRKESEMEPHINVPHFEDENANESYFEMQSEWCDECPHAEWGSADTGRGKACTNRRRLAVIPAGRFIPAKKRSEASEMEVFEDVDHYRTADMAFLKLPVTSTKNWARYVQSLHKDYQRPPFGVLTHIYLTPDQKNSFTFHFDLVEVVEDEDLLEVLIARNADAEDAIMQPYNEPTPEELAAPKAKAKSGLKGLRKKKRK